MTTESSEAVIARLDERAAEPPPESWKPEQVGQSIHGRVRRYERGSTSWGDCVICVLESLRSPGRFVSVWIFGTVLANAFQRLQPQRGEAIRIEFKGTVTPEGGGSAYKDWNLTVDRDEASDGLSFADAFGGLGAPAPPADAPAEAERRDFPTGGDVHSEQERQFIPDVPSGGPNASEPTDDDIPF